MPTLAALPGATLRECQAPSLRPLGLRADEVARRALRLVQELLPIGVTAAEALARLQLPVTPRSLAVLHQLGFAAAPVPLDPALREQIVTALTSGVWSPAVIAEETGATVEQVNAVLHPAGPPRRKRRCTGTSTDGREVARRVDLGGQMTYGGKTYSVGRKWRGRVARVREAGGELVVVVGQAIVRLSLPAQLERIGGR